MSWDVLVLNYEGTPPRDMEEMSSGKLPVPLGDPESVRHSISNYLHDMHWAAPAQGVYSKNELSIEFNLRGNEQVDSMMLHVRGGGDALSPMIQFAVPNNWSLFDCSNSEFIDPENANQTGWDDFQSFRDKVMDNHLDKDVP